MFPNAHSTVYRNEAGEPIGWSDESSYEPEFDEFDYDDDNDEMPDDDGEGHVKHNSFCQELRPGALSLPGDHWSDECEEHKESLLMRRNEDETEAGFDD